MEENNTIILFSPLDWGLGHTTRSIPILSYYQRHGFQIWIACEPGSASFSLLKAHFPQAHYLPLEGYNISYARKRKNFAFKILLQVPKILASIRRERIFIQNLVKSHPIKLILSDNRYGFYHKTVKSVFITHQLSIAAPFRWLEKCIQRINYQHIEHFDSCWVPDMAGPAGIAGKLSHPEKLPDLPVHYIGPLSRLTPGESPSIQESSLYTYLFLLSGPEPQRSILEEKLLLACYGITQKVMLVRGMPPVKEAKTRSLHDNLTPIPLPPDKQSLPKNLEVMAYAAPEQLSELLVKTQFVVCRSGYSTVMDLLIQQKKAIYIPTPGQTEQQYLAEKLYHQHWGYYFEQSDEDYPARLEQGRQFNYVFPLLSPDNLHAFLDIHGQPGS